MEEQIVLILSQLLERKINVGEEVSANTEANWDSMKQTLCRSKFLNPRPKKF